MKTFPFLLTILIFMGITRAFAQSIGNGRVVVVTQDLPFFNAIEAGGAVSLTLIQSDNYKVIIETDENLAPLVNAKVSGGTLKISTLGIRKATKLELTVLLKEISLLEVSGAVRVKSDGSLMSEFLSLKCSGATTATLDLNVSKLNTHLSGAAKLSLSGQADHHILSLSGAATLQAGKLATTTTEASGSGAAEAMVYAKDVLVINTSGMAKVRFEKEPARIERKNQTEDISVPRASHSARTNDTVSVAVGNVKIRVIEGDSTVVEVGDRKLVVDDKGSVALKRTRRNKFNGHWAGVELGLNGFLNPEFGLNMPHNYLDLTMEKSMVVNLNFYEQNIPLNKNRNFGIVSGLGLSWNNYRFADNVLLRSENKTINGYYIHDVGVKKSKLVNNYLTVPLFFELQTNTTNRKEKAYIAAGLIGGWRFSSHTKVYFLEANKPYTLKDANGNTVAGSWVSPGATRRNIVKDYNSFQQNPFKLDASLRAGWGIVNLFANYSLTPLFIKDRGTEVYPFALGITVSNF